MRRATAKNLAHAEFCRIAALNPKDDPILAVALAGDAGLVVSGDRSDMLALGDVKGIPIRSAREALGIALEAKADDET